jgi:uncharacterized membrane protein YeaQ/YmgE (transglycosylase-associated protein family)
MLWTIIAWIVFGVVVGWIAGFFVNKPTSGFWQNAALGIVGAVVGGIIANALGLGGVNSLNIFNVWSLLVSVIGAIIVVWIYNAVISRRA